ncbi:hypothetical protein L1987_19581 [Smallanthus sonchifolius]|uniref:Uncharacterized protein n=1 Tax=Smallanthus sonchifolius TaxID=185202 RepID=A0ACB9IQ74_9ASTR|nr:hypothetical protein L1987_19581 [Smallanthus sonchifolius]
MPYFQLQCLCSLSSSRTTANRRLLTATNLLLRRGRLRRRHHSQVKHRNCGNLVLFLEQVVGEFTRCFKQGGFRE